MLTSDPLLLPDQSSALLDRLLRRSPSPFALCSLANVLALPLPANSQPTAFPMSLLNLPIEKFGAIIAHVGDNCSYFENLGALAACCLMSRQFLPFARKEMRRHVVLVTNEQPNSALDRSSQPWRSCRLFNTLRSAPHLAAAVRSLTVASETGSHP